MDDMVDPRTGHESKARGAKSNRDTPGAGKCRTPTIETGLHAH